MKMKALKSMLAERFPKYRELNGVYFLPNFNHILSGFVVERRSVGIFLWKFRYPLFDYSENMSLLYSDIIYRCSFQDLKIGSIQEEYFYANLINKISEFCADSDEVYGVDDFSEQFKCIDSFQHPNIRMACGICSVLANNISDAQENLQISLNYLEGVYFERCKKILDMIEHNNARDAEGYILDLEKRMIMHLAL